MYLRLAGVSELSLSVVRTDTRSLLSSTATPSAHVMTESSASLVDRPIEIKAIVSDKKEQQNRTA